MGITSTPKPLCISTLDLNYFGYGGITTLCIVFAEVAKKMGFSPYFLTPSFDLHLTVKRFFHGKFSLGRRTTSFQQYPCYQLGALFPEAEFNAHRFNPVHLQKILSKTHSFFVVNGNNHAALPFHQLDLPYSMWIASTFWEDCRHRIQKTQWSPRKVLDYLSKPVSERLEKDLFLSARQIATITSYTNRLVQQSTPCSQEKIKTILIPIDCEQFKPSFTSARRNILFIGRADDPRKNLNLLLEAFSLFAKKSEDHELILAGSGCETLKPILQKHPYSHRIRLYYQVSEKDKIYLLQNALTLVIPSHQEGYGIVGAEAMSCGTPVISTPCGGTGDFVISGETGRILKTFSPEEMASSILELAKNDKFRNKLSKQARDFCLKHLATTIIKPKLQNFIQAHLNS